MHVYLKNLPVRRFIVLESEPLPPVAKIGGKDEKILRIGQVPVQIHVYMYICECVCVYVFVYTCVFVCVYLYVCFCVYVHVCI